MISHSFVECYMSCECANEVYANLLTLYLRIAQPFDIVSFADYQNTVNYIILNDLYARTGQTRFNVSCEQTIFFLSFVLIDSEGFHSKNILKT